MTATDVRTVLLALAKPERASFASRYFKTHPGQYGEGDVFLGLSMPQQHAIARQFAALPLAETERLLHDPHHECRMTALLIWVRQARRGSPSVRQAIADRYVANRRYVNNWDLVDSSCPILLGLPLLTGDRMLLYDLADEDSLWSRRMALVSTLTFIRDRQYADTFALAEQLLPQPHDLIHKAIGWMLREIGKRDQEALDEFLRDHIRQLPRTALRYAIERHTPAERRYFLSL